MTEDEAFMAAVGLFTGLLFVDMCIVQYFTGSGHVRPQTPIGKTKKGGRVFRPIVQPTCNTAHKSLRLIKDET